MYKTIVLQEPPAGDVYIRVDYGKFTDLMYWLERSADKGHLENCGDLVDPWNAFKDAYTSVNDQKMAVLTKAVEDAQRSANVWIGNWNKYRDGGAAKNALFAIGKVAGAANLMLATGEDAPESVMQILDANSKVYDEIMNTYFAC